MLSLGYVRVAAMVMTGRDAGHVRWRGWDVLFWVGLACWVVGFLWHWSRLPSLWILDLLVIPGMALLYWFGFVGVVVAVVGGRRWVKVLTLVPMLVVLTMLVNPAWIVAPRTWFMLHRPLFNVAVKTDPGHDYYGNELPWSLRFLAANGRVSTVPYSPHGRQQGIRFFPQWIGIPDDAGGYLYSPTQSPEGVDLYGRECADPVDLGGGWWMCELADSGL